MTDFSTYKFRCHALGKIMTDSKDAITKNQLETIAEYEAKEKLTVKQNEELLRLIAKRDNKESILGSTCIDYLVQVYVETRFGREKDIHSKYLEKGLAVEEDAITMYSLIKRDMYTKNDKRLENDFFTGEPDTHEGKSIYQADKIIDIKSSWDLFTFFQTKTAKPNKDYVYQVTGYCDLTGAKVGVIAHCLIDTPHMLIEKEKESLKWKLGVIDRENDANYIEACEAIEKAMTFGDIPMEERLSEFVVKRDDELIQQMKNRVIICREWLNDFAEKQEKKLAHAA